MCMTYLAEVKSAALVAEKLEFSVLGRIGETGLACKHRRFWKISKSTINGILRG